MENLFLYFNKNIKARYITLLKNIKYRSNSFYDSYISLAEQLIRSISTKEIKGSLHNLLNDNELKNIIFNDYLVSKETYNKLLDYGNKINSHKHRLEKEITIENVLSYMNVLYDLVLQIAKKDNILIPSYNEDFFVDLFNKGIRENENLQNELAILKRELALKDYKEEIPLEQFNELSLIDKNYYLERAVNSLKSIKLTTLEEKLNKSLEMLLNLNESIKENRSLSKAIAKMIGGNLDYFMEKEENSK